MLHNEVRLTGFISKDRTIRSNESNGEVTGLTFNIAINTRIPDPEKDGEWKDSADFFPIFVSARNRSFEYLKKHLLKGAQVQVAAYLRRASWESKHRKGDAGEALMDFRTDICATDISVIRYAKNDTAENESGGSVPGNFDPNTPPPDSDDYAGHEQFME